MGLGLLVHAPLNSHLQEPLWGLARSLLQGKYLDQLRSGIEVYLVPICQT